jgi:Replication initiator protein A
MSATNHQPGRAPVPPPSLAGRDELNLAEFPIALVADRAPRGQKTLYFEDRHGRLTVTGSDAYGLPTAADADVIVALLYLTKQRNDFGDVKVNFSRYELIKLLNWPYKGDSYKRLDMAFKRWGGVWLVYDKCWWDNKSKKYRSANMHIIDDVIFGEEPGEGRDGRASPPTSTFTWNRTFIESCQADNLRHLDLDTYFSLESAVSKRLYRFLGKRFYYQGDFVFDLKEIAFDRVGLSRTYEHNAGKIKEKLQPAIDELEAVGFLRPLSRDDRYNRIDRGQWTIRLTAGLLGKNPRPVRQLPLPPTMPDLPDIAEPVDARPMPTPPSPLVTELVNRGVTGTTAADLVGRYPADVIEAKLEVFDWLTRKQDKRVARSPAGYLVKSITDDYAAPKGFEPKAARQARAEAKRRADHEVAEARRRQREQEARDRATREEVDAYLRRLTPAERKALEATVLDRADAEARRGYEEAPARYRANLLLGLVREHVAQELGRKAITART